jgi:hypothetical protein
LSALQQRQQASRDEYDGRATGAVKVIGDAVRDLVNVGTSTLVSEFFPMTLQRFTDLTTEQWIITSVDAELADYGKAIWQGRDVEALLVRVSTQRESAIAGLYASDCLVLGYLIDTEFRVSRDPIEASCADEAAIAEWAAGRQMKSVWNLASD